ncbi:MAG: hypothetical protein LBL74_04520 [Bacteroidales bacterium]|nr:hypothetical protein [Bacteroidales bacterium]
MKRILIILFSLISIYSYSQVKTDKIEGHINYYRSIKNKSGKINVSKLFENANRQEIIEDSIQKTFEIVGIEKLDSCYKVDKNTLEPIDAYVISVSNVIDGNLKKDTFNILGEQYPLTGVYHILSCDTMQNGIKIEIGQRYNMLLISYFDRILPNMYHETNMPICLNNICILHFPIGFIMNFYTTPNLKGLHYISL